MCNRLAVGDTESKSASKYADLFNFDVLELEEFSPQNYIALIDAAGSAIPGDADRLRACSE
jgi:hypothetical protein